jgi:hypothetical protein
MRECPNCGSSLDDEDQDTLGARCPSCREPLYERSGGPRLVAESEPDDDRGACSLHPENVAVGTCERCGNFHCRVCRTRWAGGSLCLACLDRQLQAQERSPEDIRTHRRQAVLSVVMGLITWVLCPLCILVIVLAARAARDAEGLLALGWMLGLGSLVPACFGVGLGVSAVRARGDRLILATCGLVLSGVYLGVLIGAILLAVWRG